jgi:hypothetical protein
MGTWCLAEQPENLITWRAPAALAASINVFCVSTISMRGAEIMRTRSTPSRADPKLLGLDMSPSPISTVGTFSSPAAFALFRTKIRTGTRSRTNSLAINEPAVPVAPVRRITVVSPLVSLFSESGASEAQRPPETETFGAGQKSHGSRRGAVGDLTRPIVS